MEEIVVKTYKTNDGKLFDSKEKAEEHEKALSTQIETIKKLPYSQRIAYIDYCYYVILTAKAELMLRNYVGPLNITEVVFAPKDADLQKRLSNSHSMSSGYSLSEVGHQINTLLKIVGITLTFESDVEGYRTALKVAVNEKFKTLTIDDCVGIIRETLLHQ